MKNNRAKKSQECPVVTIDGLRGTGKSKLACSLRSILGCNVLEIGPIFRLLAWLVDQEFAESIAAAQIVLARGLDAGWIRFRLDKGGRISANCIEVIGTELEADLWDPRLDSLIQGAAGSCADLWLAQLAQRIVGFQPAVVVGREVGAKLFPDASVKIVLVAEKQKRLERKVSQLNGGTGATNRSFSAEHSEARRDWTWNKQSVVLIDTTNLTSEEVLKMASSCITSELGRIASISFHRLAGTVND